MVIIKASTITRNFGTGHGSLNSARRTCEVLPNTHVYRVWIVDTETREYLFDTGINNYEPVCIFPQPEDCPLVLSN